MSNRKNAIAFGAGVLVGIVGTFLAACAGFRYPDVIIKNPPETNVTVPITNSVENP